MYITTFYSFKGGVGRTMALVNVAVELANRGSRVLAVDFDLEAPGLDTFNLGREAGSTPGMVDFVESYLSTNQAPDAKEFRFEAPEYCWKRKATQPAQQDAEPLSTDQDPLDLEGHGGPSSPQGSLWIMPSGSQDQSYANRLNRIDWGLLYEHFDGYLLFEDLKEQWRADLNPDYVLIDSRTGYTDVGGICTRQLPDAVVLLFFPNQQNLRGLKKVVSDIRAEESGPRHKAIDLHFVLSNVPDLDDEAAILENIIASFQGSLGFRREPLAIHRYNSLSLLNQTVFTKDRPRSRLAREYRTLVSELARANPEDRAGALDYIEWLERRRAVFRLPGGSEQLETLKNRLNRIQTHHSTDGEVLFRLGKLDYDGPENSIDLFDRSIDVGYSEPAVHLARGELRRAQFNDREGASQDALAVLSVHSASYGDLRRALLMLLPEHLNFVPGSPAMEQLPNVGKISLANNLTRSREEANVAATVLQSMLRESDLKQEELSMARQGLVLTLLALRRFSEALAVIRCQEARLEDMQIQSAFNYGMARWAEQQEISSEPFARVVELDHSEPRKEPNANYHQCLALAQWAVGNTDAAERSASQSTASIRGQSGWFSAWRYLTVTRSTFADDLAEMLEMIRGDHSIMPRFMRDATH